MNHITQIHTNAASINQAEKAQVDVVVPTFNAAKTIERSLASISKQTLLPQRVLVIDDCSDDNTVELVSGFANRFQNLSIQIYRHKKNLGAASARNTGWDRAQSTYVAFLDADDTWHPNKLQIQYNWMNQHKNLVLSGHACIECLDGDFPDISQLSTVRQIAAQDFLLFSQFSTPTAMIKRDINYRFEAGKRHCEDYLLWLQVVLDGGRVDYIDLPLAATYKPLYGAAGISAQLWRMEIGEIETYWQLSREGRISRISSVSLSVWSALKYFRRCVAVTVRRLVRPVAARKVTDY